MIDINDMVTLHSGEPLNYRVMTSNICTAMGLKTLGSKVADHAGFTRVLFEAITKYDWTSCKVPGQAFIQLPDAIPFVSAGIGKQDLNPENYVLRCHRGKVSAYLKREFATPTTGCAVVVYTTGAYLSDPDITEDERKRVETNFPTHVLVAVLAFSANQESQLSPYRFVANLAGGNKEALLWTADEIRDKAKEIINSDKQWSVVSD